MTELSALEGAAQISLDWVKQHHWRELDKRRQALTATNDDDEGRRCLPNSQMHTLRAGLYAGQAVADAPYALVRHRYQGSGIEVFDGALPHTLFEARKGEVLTADDATHLTKLLDALDVASLHEDQLAKRLKQGGLS